MRLGLPPITKFLLVALVASISWAANAAIIGPTMDWKPIREGAAEFGISDAMIDEILSAGVELECGEPGDPAYKSLNGWFLGKYRDGIFTNAHGVTRDGQLLPNIEKCVVRSLLDMEKAVAEGGRSADAVPYPITLDKATIRTRTLVPETPEAWDDRGYVPLLAHMPGVVGIRYRPIPSYRVSTEVFLVSRQNNTLKTQGGETGPVIQRAVILDIVPAAGTNPS